VADKVHDTIVKFDKYRNLQVRLQRHPAVLPVTAWLSCSFSRPAISTILFLERCCPAHTSSLCARIATCEQIFSKKFCL